MRPLIAILLFGCVAGCSVPNESQVAQAELAPPWLEGVFEYVPPLRGQSIGLDGHFTFLYGPADGSGPMVTEAGTYEVSGDTVTNTVVFSSDTARLGRVFKWTAASFVADTLTFVVMNADGEVTGQGRAVRVN